MEDQAEKVRVNNTPVIIQDCSLILENLTAFIRNNLLIL